MNRLYVIIIIILCFAVIPVAIAGDIIKHYEIRMSPSDLINWDLLKSNQTSTLTGFLADAPTTE